MKRFFLWLTILLMDLAFPGLGRAQPCAELAPAEPAVALVVVESSPLDAAAVARFAELNNHPFARAQCPGLRDAAALQEAFARWGAERVLVFDTEHGRIDLWWSAQRAWMSRVLPEAGVTPYQLAFVASELLTLSAGVARPLPRWGLRAASAALGPEWIAAGSPYAGAARLALALSGWWGAPDGRSHLVAGLGSTLFARAREPASLGQVRFARHELLLRVGPGWRGRRVALSVAGLAGFAMSRVTARTPFGEEQRFFAALLGGEARAELRLWRGLGLYLTVAASHVAPRRAYRVQGSVVARDGTVTGSAGFGLVWTWTGP